MHIGTVNGETIGRMNMDNNNFYLIFHILLYCYYFLYAYYM